MPRNFEDNVINVVAHLRKILSIRVTDAAIAEITEHPDYPSLISISDSLSAWKIKTLAVKLDHTQLKQIPLPAVVHLRSKIGQFFSVVTAVEGDLVSATDADTIPRKIKVDAFNEIWSGGCLLIQNFEDSGEKDFIKRRNSGRLIKIVELLHYLLPIGIFSMFCMRAAGSLSALTLAAIFLCVPAIIISWLLIKMHYGEDSKFIKAACSAFKKGNCDDVLKSRASKIFGVPLAALGFIYFTFLLLSALILTAFNMSEYVLLELAFFLSPAILYMAFALFYQGLVLRAWCIMCLAIVAITSMQLVIVFGAASVPSNFMSILPITPYAISALVLSIWIWMVLRPGVISRIELSSAKKDLNSLRNNRRLVDALIKIGMPVSDLKIDHEISHGAIDAKYSIVVVTNPTCNPCRITHQRLKLLAEKNPGSLRITYRFLCTSNSADIATTVVRNILATTIEKGPEAGYSLLTAWYDGSDRQVSDRLLTTGYYEGEDSPADQLIAQNLQWCALNGITSTPSIIVNGNRLTSPLTVDSLEVLLRQ